MIVYIKHKNIGDLIIRSRVESKQNNDLIICVINSMETLLLICVK